MNDEQRRLRDLWAAFVSGETLSENDGRFLLEALRADAGTRNELLADMEFDGMIKALGDREETGESVAQAFLQALEAAKHATRFIKSVETRIREDAEGRRRPRPTRRSMTARQSGWVPFLLAAVVLFGIVVFASLSSSGSRQEGSVRPERARIEPSAQEAGRKLAELDKARAELARKETEARLAALRLEEQRLDEERKKAAVGADEEFRKRIEEAVRKRKEEEQKLARLREDERREEKDRTMPVPSPDKPNPQERPIDRPQGTPPTKVCVARLVKIEGEVSIVTSSGKTRAKEGEDLLAGQGLETAAANGAATVVYPDRTRLDVGPDTDIRELKEDGGKRIFLQKGSILAEVAKQPRDQSLLILTPHAEAKVVGTTLKIVVDLDPKKGTRLEVEEGKVQLKNTAGRTVEVGSGHYAVAAPGIDPGAKPIPGGLIGLAGCWKFDEAGGTLIQDISGNRNHGTISGNPRRSNGRLGLALDLDGVKDFVTIPHSPSLNPGSSSWAIAAWIRTRIPDPALVVLKDNGNLTGYYYLQIGATACMGISPGDTDIKVFGTKPTNDGKWHHVVGVRSGPRTLQLYVDGVLDGTHTIDGVRTGIETTTVLKIGGGDPRFGQRNFAGSIDDVCLYRRALTADEVKRLYQER